MPALTGWWDRRSSLARVELYTRWSFHSFALVEFAGVCMVIDASNASTAVTWTLVTATIVHCCLFVLLTARSLDRSAGLCERPTALTAGTAAATAASIGVVLVLQASGRLPESGEPVIMVSCFLAFGAGSLVLNLASARRVVLVALLAPVCLGPVAVAAGLSVPHAVIHAISATGMAWGIVFTYRFSAWLLHVVRELDEAKELQARLAVAEERLRFGRDLHDVIGRNLTVIALKSELAAQLARRGRPEAYEQMIEVQRIARESQREVRAVVRGYRAAELEVELAGARSVLAAAGVGCRVEATGSADLPDRVQAALGWVVREATTNVLRHSEGGDCVIRLRVAPGDDGSATLLVENDGVITGTEGEPGSGLHGIRERLVALGGTLTAGPRTGGVFRLVARIPLGDHSS